MANKNKRLRVTTDVLPFIDQHGILRSISSTRPSHYILKIQSFSSLAKNNVERYDSREFEARGYEWKLILHPNGNKNKNIDNHISLYLMMVVDGTSFPLGWEVHATFRFFLLDQINDNYLFIQDTTTSSRRFYNLKHEWGMDRLVSLEAFKNPSNGYLVNDSCAFGAEVHVCKVTRKGEYLTMVKSPISEKHTWRINNFSKLVERQESTAFNAGEQKWKISIHPKGTGIGAGNYISLFLVLADPESLPPDCRIFAEFTLRILEKVCCKHKYFSTTRSFSALICNWGWAKFISLSDFYQPNMGYLKNDSCIVEAQVTVHGLSKE